MIVPRVWVSSLLALVVACGGDRPAHIPDDPPPHPDGERGRVVFLGTSLTAGLGLDPAQASPALLQAKIDSAGLPYTAVNAGVSGETSAGALRRIDWLLQQPVAVLVIETGANDALRGLNVDTMTANIQAIIDHARKLNPTPAIVLVGMRAPPNLGPDYVRRFRGAFPALAERNEVLLVPFLLDGVAGRPSLNQGDMIHPTAAGQRIIAETVWRVVGPVLQGGHTASR